MFLEFWFLNHTGVVTMNGVENFDYTLPDNITNYVICASFTDEGEVDYLSMKG